MRRPPFLRILNQRFLGDSGPVLARCVHPLALYDEPAGGTGKKKDDDEAANDPLLQEFRRMLASAVSSGKVSKEDAPIIRDNFKLRRRVQTLKDENVQLAKAAKVPEGSLVLTPDQKKEWEAFTALKLPAADVKKVVEERDKLKADAATQAHAQLLDEVADSLDYDADTLQGLVETKQLHVEMKEVRSRDDDNKVVVTRVAHVRPKGDEKAALEPLHDYAERELSEAVFTMLTTRKVSDEDNGEGSGGGSSRALEEPYRDSAIMGGVRLPAARQQRQPSGAAQQVKAEERAAATKRESVGYL